MYGISIQDILLNLIFTFRKKKFHKSQSLYNKWKINRIFLHHHHHHTLFNKYLLEIHFLFIFIFFAAKKTIYVSCSCFIIIYLKNYINAIIIKWKFLSYITNLITQVSFFLFLLLFFLLKAWFLKIFFLKIEMNDYFSKKKLILFY